MTQTAVSPMLSQQPESTSFVDRHSLHPLLFVAVCLGVIFFAYHIVGSGIAFVAIGPKITRENATAMRLFTTVGQLLFILAPTLLFARLLNRRWGEVFWWKIPSFRETAFMMLALISLQQLLEVYLFVQDLIPLPEPLQKILGSMRDMYREMLKNVVKAESIPELMVVIGIAAIVPSFVEEMLFRGVVQKAMERVFQPLIAVLVTGIIFGAFHLDLFDVVPLMAIGCYLSFLRWRSKSIVLPIVAHFLNNLAAVVSVYMGMGYETKLSTTELGISDPLAAITQTVAFGGLFALSLRAYIKTTEPSQTTT